MKLSRGFSLIEVLIVVLIIGVVSAIAYPAYGQYVLRGYRADAKIALQEAAQWMERNYSLTQNYTLQANGAATNNAVILAQRFGVVPAGATGTAQRYVLSFTGTGAGNLDQQTFTLQAIPQNAQSADNTKCGTLTINHLQARTASGAEGAVACWSR